MKTLLKYLIFVYILYCQLHIVNNTLQLLLIKLWLLILPYHYPHVKIQRHGMTLISKA